MPQRTTRTRRRDSCTCRRWASVAEAADVESREAPGTTVVRQLDGTTPAPVTWDQLFGAHSGPMPLAGDIDATSCREFHRREGRGYRAPPRQRRSHRAANIGPATPPREEASWLHGPGSQAIRSLTCVQVPTRARRPRTGDPPTRPPGGLRFRDHRLFMRRVAGRHDLARRATRDFSGPEPIVDDPIAAERELREPSLDPPGAHAPRTPDRCHLGFVADGRTGRTGLSA